MSCCHHHDDDHDHRESIEEDIEEMNHFREIVVSFKNYRNDSQFFANDKKTRTAVDINSILTNAIAAGSSGLFGNEASNDESSNPTAERNISKVRSTLKQFVREWSKEGQGERDSTFKVLIDAMKRHLPPTQEGEKNPFVVCPGSGLGRLPYELAKAGYDAQGNEFSYHMILGSHFILNSGHLAVDSVVIFPYCLNTAHSLSEKSRLRPVRIPDEVPSMTLGQMSMCAGEFVETYEKQGYNIADGLVTCFFIDTAKNILLYIRTFAGMLRPGGVWANLGPLLYHYAENDEEISIELSWEEVRELICEYFEIAEEQTNIECVYSSNKESLSQTEYHSVFFVARRNNKPVEGFSNPVF
jgi:carnosine N-methyltransferase